MMFKTPVLFLIFNRPETTARVFEKIREIKPKNFYVAADGPRSEIDGEHQLCQKARNIVREGVDWECDVHYKFEDSNLGCGYGVSSAITWAFENEDRLIILEDDVVPSLPFFSYCEDLLAYYNNDPRVWAVTGLNHFNGEKNLNDDSYFFSHYASIWGWATWKRCWDLYDVHMGRWPDFKKSGIRFSHLSKREGDVRFKVLDGMYNNDILTGKKLGTWDTQFSFPIWANSGVGTVPAENLITNIGIEGTHSSQSFSIHNLPASENYKIEKRPHFFQTNHLYDESFFKLFLKKKPLIKRIFKKIKKILFC